MQTVAAVADGELTFPPPFDLSTSAALASNIDRGWLAQKLADVTASRDCGYEVSITALTPGVPDPMRREIINTTVSSTRLLFTLLESLMDELEARMDAAEHPCD